MPRIPKLSNKVLIISILSTILAFSNVGNLLAADDKNDVFNPAELINHHILDDYLWHFWDGHYGTLYLPVILYSSDKGLIVFSSHNFFDANHNILDYEGYRYEHGHVSSVDGGSFIDISITKNVLFLFINATVLLWVFFAVARGYKKNIGKAPKGIQSFFEPIILFVRDEIVKPNIGPKYERFLPYMLSLFFFIWFGNLFGLMPGAANLTGNIAVTSILAIFTFVLTIVNTNRNYWKHIFNTPGVPWWLKLPVPLLPTVEIIGIFSKPFSLLLRLFVAITAGHIVVLSLISLTFIFQSYSVGILSALITTFINLIELLVATIQAYVFTLFSSMYIGMAMEEEH
ncbi:MAG: F0F1 ATP synthase subunit A [Bacteroidetes bacterium]|nr:F0F1 ATP synthase subunit A [Bacteroidota bacterium]MDA1118944.1 F0F1 ATP synthase subunit A [Bacteroidota bacterium]